jgi:hypothetical protein
MEEDVADLPENIELTLRQVKAEAEKHLRLIDTLNHLAQAEEEAAAAFVSLELPEHADELLQRAVIHYRWAVQTAKEAKDARRQEIDLMSIRDGS